LINGAEGVLNLEGHDDPCPRLGDVDPYDLTNAFITQLLLCNEQSPMGTERPAPSCENDKDLADTLDLGASAVSQAFLYPVIGSIAPIAERRQPPG